MAKVSFDGLNKQIHILPGVTSIDVASELYSEWKRWLITGDNSKWEQAFRTSGGDPTNPDQTSFTPQYFFLMNGWQVEGSTGETIIISTNLYPDDGDFDAMLVQSNNTSINLQLSNSPVVSSDLEKALAYGGMVYVNSFVTESGTSYPYGTTARPVSNMIDAIAVAAQFGIQKFHVVGTITVTGDYDRFEVFGGAGETEIIINGNVTLSNGVFKKCTIIGDLNGSYGMIYTGCHFADGLENLSGQVFNTGFRGSFKIKENADILMIDCYSEIGGAGSPTLIMPDNPASSNNIALRGYMGGLLVKGFKGAGMNGTISFISGKCTLDSTNTGGYVSIRNIPFNAFTNNSNGTTVDTDSLLASQKTLSDAVKKIEYSQSIIIDTVNGFAGAAYPSGTASHPVNNLADAHTIAENNNIYNFILRSDLTIDAPLSDGYIFTGKSGGETITLTGTALPQTTLKNVYVTGDAGGVLMRFEGCRIAGVTNFVGSMWDCIIMDDIAIASGSEFLFKNCFTAAYSEINANTSTPVIYMGSLLDEEKIIGNIRGWHGPLQIANMDNTLKSLTIHADAGYLIIDSSNTDGWLYAQGFNSNAIVNNSSGDFFFNSNELKVKTDDESREASKADIEVLL
jgi:hypothetical protein